MSGGERWNVAPERNIDVQRLGGAFVGEVFGKAAAQLPGVAANDIVFNRTVTGIAAKDLDADAVLGNVGFSVLERLGHYVEQKLRQEPGTREV